MNKINQNKRIKLVKINYSNKKFTIYKNKIRFKKIQV